MIISHLDHMAELHEPQTTHSCNFPPRFAHRVTGVVRIRDKAEISVESDITSAEVPRIDENTRFPVASLSKVFTAIAILQSVERSELSLETRLDELVPELTIKSDFRESSPIRMKHLLSHSSGLPTEIAAERTFDQNWKLEELPGMLAKVTLVHPTGQRSQYSNLGYNLLGLVLQRISGQPFEVVMAERVFAAMGLDSAGYHADDQTVPRYIRSPDGTITRGPGFATNELPAGGLIISASDWARFLQHLLDAGSPTSCLSANIRQKLVTPSPYRPLHGIRQQQGAPAIGFFVERVNGTQLAFHTGYKPGYLTYCHVLPGTACFTFIASPQIPGWQLGDMHVKTVKSLLDASCLGQQDRQADREFVGYVDKTCLDQLPVYTPTPGELQHYAGKYAVFGYYEINFEVRDGALHTDYGAMDDLRPVAPAEFVAVRYLTGERIRFVEDRAGSGMTGVYISMTFHARMQTPEDLQQHETLMAQRFSSPK